MHQNRWRLELHSRPYWGSLQRSPDPLAAFKAHVKERFKEKGWDGNREVEREGERR